LIRFHHNLTIYFHQSLKQGKDSMVLQ